MESNKTINDLPLPLIQEILLRLPVKSLLLSSCVCRTWLHLISNPNFTKSHFELAASPTHRCLFIATPNAVSLDLDALFHDGYAPVRFPLPCGNPRGVKVRKSCRGFILLDKYPNFIMWNPLTGAHKQIPYRREGNERRSGFAYDPSKDDYMIVLAWRDNNEEEKGRFSFFSVRNNSWKNLEVAFPIPLPNSVWRRGQSLNGAFHWVVACSSRRDEYILVFDLMERSFSEITLPEPAVGNGCLLVELGGCNLMELGGCLALHSWCRVHHRAETWVMKEYKVQSSWTLYAILEKFFLPVDLSTDGNMIGFVDYIAGKRGLYKYSFSGEQLEYFNFQQFPYYGHSMYTESLLSLPEA